ncbi:MAG: methylmalonyl-CoA mutase family protein, partial [Cyclobacteriaceae bacterium]
MQKRYRPKNKLRIITATSLFDGHDVAINMMRRIIQAAGCEVIHLGHNRSAEEIVRCAIQEDAHAIAITSYQGGHIEFFKYLFDLLEKSASGHILIFGGGGGTIFPDEAKELHEYGICRIYSPDDGRKMGLEGMVDDLLEKADFCLNNRNKNLDFRLQATLIQDADIARWITLGENGASLAKEFSQFHKARPAVNNPPILGITGTGGAGKSSVVDELIRRFLQQHEEGRLAVLSIDPTKKKTGGALLGDRIRMNAINHPRVFMRSMATRRSDLALPEHIGFALEVFKAAGFDFIILETSGIGQSDTEIEAFSDLSLYVMTPEFGAASQLEKIDMLDFADFIAINKFDKQGAEDAIRDVRKQYRRNQQLWDIEDQSLPIFGTMASQFNDKGMNRLYISIMKRMEGSLKLHRKEGFQLVVEGEMHKTTIIPGPRLRYLSEIAENNRDYDRKATRQKDIAQKLYGLKLAIDHLNGAPENKGIQKHLQKEFLDLGKELDPKNLEWLENWSEKVKSYQEEFLTFKVREKEIKIKTFSTSLSNTRIPKVALPAFEAWGDLLYWHLRENLPGEFPFTAGVFPLKRENEDPTRMFAGEGGPERTNKRFHYLSKGMPAARLSTAFDSVSLYGEDPAIRPDIFGKIGNAGVSICTLDDTKKLYSGFDLSAPTTSVSMTINGPAAIFTAFYLNVAVDQQCELYIKNSGLENEIREKIRDLFGESYSQPEYQGILPEENNGLGLMLLGLTGDKVLPPEVYGKIKAATLKKIRGTVQSDILKEDQAQNTCIFSTAFSLKLMGDVQEYFVRNGVRNFYSVSVSGYHIAEAGANPITQLALTLSNGFTYVEYFLSRGMKIDDFAPNLSFFFSNGIDPEYAVIGRVARRIWAKALKLKYGGNSRSQMLKYHIQTSGRSLHAQEIDFNDIRTTLQALYAIYDNCNSLHTNAYDEAITTPTESSVRRALAIQLIINKELGLAKNEN